MCNRTSFDTLLDFGSVAEEFLLDCYDLSSLHMNSDELTAVGLLRKQRHAVESRATGIEDSLVFSNITGFILTDELRCRLIPAVASSRHV